MTARPVLRARCAAWFSEESTAHLCNNHIVRRASSYVTAVSVLANGRVWASNISICGVCSALTISFSHASQLYGFITLTVVANSLLKLHLRLHGERKSIHTWSHLIPFIIFQRE